MNGWQNVSENNTAKTIGTQLSYSPNDKMSFTYNTLIGNEASVRHFHDLIFKNAFNKTYALWLQGDAGFQAKSGGAPDSWNGVSLINRFTASEKWAFSARGERYFDPNQVIVKTGTSNALKTHAASVGVDFKPEEILLYRFEARSFFAKDSVFQSPSGMKPSQTVLTLSMSLTL